MFHLSFNAYRVRCFTGMPLLYLFLTMKHECFLKLIS
jgi:hypothetical protein